MSKVLLIDNETSRATAMREALERGGFETIAATSGNEALKTFLNEVPDLVMAGPLAAEPDEEFCRQIRDTRPGVDTPIILYCESLSGDELKTALERSGCNVFLEIPASDERLLEVCRHALIEAVGSTTGPANEEDAAALPVPAYASPDAAVADLESNGLDIDAHLDSMFQTGAPPPAQETAEPDVSFDTDFEAQPVEPMDMEQAAEPEAAPPWTAEPVDNEVELVGFQPDAVSFEAEGEVDPGIQPGIASDARSLIQDPPEPTAWEAHDVTTPDVADHEMAPPSGPEAGYAGAGSSTPAVDFSVGEDARPDESTPVEVMPEPAAGASRGWLWGLVAASVLVGVALFSVFRPSGEDTTPAQTVARPSSATPRVDPTPALAAQPVVDDAVVDSQIPGAVDAADAIASSDVAAATQRPTVENPPAAADTFVPAGSEDVPGATDPADNEPPDIDNASATVVATDTAPPPPEPSGVDTPPAPAAASATATPADPANVAPPSDAQTPEASSNYVFEPSTEIVDAATAGEGFTAPSAIDRAQPTYRAADVPPGGETVILRVLVNDWGKAVRVDVEKGRAGSPLVDAAIDAVLETRFRPANVRGRDVRAWATETFVFE